MNKNQESPWWRQRVVTPFWSAFVGMTICAVPTASAQDSASADPEEGGKATSSEPTKADPLKLQFKLSTEGYSSENLDLLPLDESSDQAIIDTDDRHTFAFSGISARADYLVDEDLLVHVALSHYGLWGSDQLGESTQKGGALSFGELAFTYTPLDLEALAVSFKVGRQPFKIGGVSRDYILDDVVDAATLSLDLRKFGRVRVLLADLYSGDDLPDASFVGYVGGREPLYGLRGDTFTLRSGFVYEQEGENALLEGLMLKAYYFYADIGGGPINESGADISYGGSLGNFSDNDWAAVFGGRVGYELELYEGGTLKVFGEGAQSTGLDRREFVARDVEIKGMAFGGGLESALAITSGVGVEVAAGYHMFDGGEYSSDGLLFNHGFVGFKGKQLGGLNLNRYAGWHPSAYIGGSGVAHNPHNKERVAGTSVLHAGLGLTIQERATLRVDWWSLADTSSTFLDQASLDSLDPPFGYSREEFAAQERLGKALGQEIDVSLNYRFSKSLTGFATYGVFTPGEFYDIRIDKVAGTSLGGDVADFWVGSAGAEVSF